MALSGYYKRNLVEAGVDEAGRGCLAGPVYAAAVILPKNYRHPLLNDSKKMSERERMLVRSHIEKHALAWAVAACDHLEIDRLNILNASILAMHRALDKLPVKPQLILVDGNRFKKYRDINHVCIIGGDASYKSIAAASVLAKTYRDEYMMQLHALHPVYGWNKNKAYATSLHREAILREGESPYHRKSFRIRVQYKLEFS